MIALAAIVAVAAVWWLVANADIKASVDRDLRLKHEHDYQRVGYGGAGWSLYRCECGDTEIDA